MPDVRVPQEAIDAAAMAFSARAIPSLVTYAKAESAIAAALPFLRAQWEADLLSDEAIEVLVKWYLGPRYPAVRDEGMIEGYRAAARTIIRAALGSRFVPEESEERSNGE